MIENPNENNERLNAPHYKAPQETMLQFDELVLASRFMRFLASVIDNVILWVFGFIGSMLLFNLGALLGIIAFVALQLYYMKTYGQTLAKRWLGLRVVDYLSGTPVSYYKYIVREVIDTVFSYLGVIFISAIVAFVTRERRSLTDLIVDTIVISEQRK